MKNSPGLVLTLACTAGLLAACGSQPVTRAPVEDRGTSRAGSVPAAAPAASRTAAPAPAAAPAASAAPAAPEAAKPLRGLENAGKPGHYTVQRGDTLIRISLDNGQNWRDIARWNSIDNPNLIEVGEVLRVVPPVGDGQVARPIVSSSPTATPLPPSTRSPAPPASPGTAQAPALQPPLGQPPAAQQAVTAPAQAPNPPPAPASDEELAWVWPARGTVVGAFDDAKNKGVDIAGKAGDPVLAAADGRVVYAGSGLRGYGNLIILKHNNTYLTAYAHNQTLLVKEDQTVKQGQRIAEMGNSDADRVKLHFEIRRLGRPVDPVKLLPPR